MFRMILESNHEKLEKEGIYTPEQFDALLRQMWLDVNFKEESKDHYILEDSFDELGEMLVLDTIFDKLGFIIPNLKTWITYSDYEGEVDQLSPLSY